MSPRRRTRIAGHHLEWILLIDTEGPFLSLPVLAEVFPQGLDADDPAVVAESRARFDAWREDGAEAHEAFVRYVLEELLEYEELVQKPDEELRAEVPGRRLVLRPSLVIAESPESKPALLVSVVDRDHTLDRPVAEEGLYASPIERARMLAVATGVPLGLVTNGRQWAVVHAARDKTTSTATWETDLWFDERLTFRAFVSLLSVRRTIGAADDETLLALFERSADDERDVTDRLGYQVRRSVELFVHAFDRADEDAGRVLFEYVPTERLYEAAVTVAMRIVFLLAAEARGLLPDDEAWVEAYAVTPLREILEAEATAGGEELLERRFDAWPRLLATFRAVHGGVEHDQLRLAGYGGGLFDPERFPFLERVDGRPLRVPNRTILNVLESLQTLEVEVAGGRERRPLSYTALGVEQIGHTYERLLDHTAVRADAPAVGLVGKRGEEPEVALADLEGANREGREALVARVVELTGKTPKGVDKLLDTEPSDQRKARLHAVCRGDTDLISRVEPLLGVVRDDDFETPMVFRTGGVYVTESPERRTTGTYYTPPSLTEPIARYALEPVVYRGPAEGKSQDEWELKTPAELLELKVCDIAMGSGAFLVAACRYLADRVVEAWDTHPDEAAADLPADPEERGLGARRLIAERCLYGVDKNPLAVEIAKVSLWLETMRKDRPFTFVDHSLRCGDSLLGLTSLDQLETLTLKPAEADSVLVEGARTAIRGTLDEVRGARVIIEASDALDLREAEQKATTLAGAERKLRALKMVGDLVVGAALEEAAGTGSASTTVEAAADEIREALAASDERRDALLAHVEARAGESLMLGRVPGAPEPPQPFHWVLEFPEVFERVNSGFDVVVGNPPFLGGKKISRQLGNPYRELLMREYGEGRRGNTDLVSFFLLRSCGVAPAGFVGLIATNSVRQGETRDFALTPLLDEGWHLYRATSTAEWPGEAGVHVSHLWLSRTDSADAVLDGVGVRGITSSLTPSSRRAGQPFALEANRGVSHYGCIPNGPFEMAPVEAESMLARDPDNARVVKPYLITKDLTSRPDQSPSRWIVDFDDMPAEAAMKYSAPFAYVERHVRPWRRTLTKKPRQQRLWWQFEARQPGMREATGGLRRVLVGPQTAKWWFVTWAPNGWVYSQKVTVFARDDDWFAGVLTSTLHEMWARKWSGTLESRLSYAGSDCFINFPMPEEDGTIAELGSRYLRERRTAMVADGQGLTVIYNRLNEQPADRSDSIEKLRRLRCELDRAVADVYGWDDLELDHDFRETPLGLRYTISEGVKTEVLDRLLELNHERYEGEVRRGLRRTNAAKRTTRRTSADDSEQLFAHD